MPWLLLLKSPWTWIAVAFAALGAYAAIQTGRLSACKGNLDAAHNQIEALGERIKAQNVAVEALKAEGDKRVAKATQGAKAAREATAQATTEAERLRLLAATAGSDCNKAVENVRNGL